MSTRILSLPLPIFAAAIIQQVEPPAISAPAWVNSFLIGVFVLGYFLNLVGKFPGATGERRTASFTDADRRKLEDMFSIVTAEDTAKARWPRVWAPIAETLRIQALVEELAKLRGQWEMEHAEWKLERADWKAERARMERRITELEDVVRRQEHALEVRG